MNYLRLDFWLSDFLPMPKGALVLAESSYRDELPASAYSRRCLLVDFAGCSEDSLVKIDFNVDGIEFAALLRFLMLYYSDVFDDVFGKSEISKFSGRGGEDTIIYYCDGFMGVMRLQMSETKYGCWHLDFALSCSQVSDNQPQ